MDGALELLRQGILNGCSMYILKSSGHQLREHGRAGVREHGRAGARKHGHVCAVRAIVRRAGRTGPATCACERARGLAVHAGRASARARGVR